MFINLSLLCWLEEFDRIAIRIFQLHLSAVRTNFHFVAEMEAGVLQPIDVGGEVRDAQHDSVPAARLLTLAVAQRARA